MSRYATKQSFGGQRASIGRVVVVAQEELEDGGGVARPTGRTAIVGGDIGEIHEATDTPIIYTCNGEIYHPDERTMDFVSTASEADIEALRPGQWTWPVRIHG